MPDNITSRGLKADGSQETEAALVAPQAMGSIGHVDWEDISLRAITLNAVRNLTTKKLADSDLKTKATLANNGDWQVLEWDPEAGLIVIVPDAAILITTDKDASKASEGFVVAANASFPLHVAGAPLGRVYVRRSAAGQPNISAYAFGSRRMAFASNRLFNTPPVNA
jgi:hypothetical protein